MKILVSDSLSKQGVEVLEKAGSGMTTFARAFGRKKWSKLKPYLKSRDGLWGFDL